MVHSFVLPVTSISRISKLLHCIAENVDRGGESVLGIDGLS